MQTSARLLVSVFVGVVLAAPAALGRTETGPFDKALTPGGTADIEIGEDPPLWEDLGTLSHRVTTSNHRAQRYFDQGLRLAYAFNHAEARRAFRAAQRQDPSCAMCYWGEALVLGPNINAPMEAKAIAPALAAVEKARSTAVNASPSEQALIAALAVRYRADSTAERSGLDRAYAEAMGAVASRYPDDDNIAVLYAESLMDLSPWDYWEQSGRQAKGKTEEIVSTLQRVLQRHPDHPGAIHLYIHMVEASTDPKRAEPYAERLAALMPGAGHMVHMPSHIYFRIGRYRDSLLSNREAVATDERYLQQNTASGIYAGGYYPHNVHFLMVSAQMAGDGATALQAADRLAGLVAGGAMNEAAWVQPIQAAPYFVHAQFSEQTVVRLVRDPGDRLPYIKAMWYYMRGVVAARGGDAMAAEREAGAIGRLAETADFRDLEAGGVPAKEVLNLARCIVTARLAQARGDLPTTIREFEAAAVIEDGLPYLEPPYWYYPVRQSLGAAHLLAGNLTGAEAAFRKSLEQAPHNAWSLFGLAEVYRRQGKQREAEETARLFQRAWLGQQGPPALDRL